MNDEISTSINTKPFSSFIDFAMYLGFVKNVSDCSEVFSIETS